MEKPLLTICTVNYNSAFFIELMLYAFERLTHYPYKVIIRDNGSKKEDFLKLKEIVSKYNNVCLYQQAQIKSGSMAHGEAPNDLVSRIDTEYGVIMDADATFLVKDWDSILLSKMSDQVPIYGTQADGAGGKPKDFPLMFAVIFKTDILKRLQIDFRPREIEKFEDTGWELREKYKRAGLDGGLLYDFNTRTYKKGPFADIVCSEYYLQDTGEGSIFATHFGRGSAPSSKRLFKIKGTSLFVRVINKLFIYANLYKWKFDRKQWIFKCKQLIDNQL